ncbi:MAG: type II secretion system F family protein, partial [Candidatus Hydrogenedentes bacterium]|nr:type II secretion system F family protein [Candidatus Hydrogenedentota bacterium]
MVMNAEKPAGPIKRVRRKAPVAEIASPPRAVSSVSVEILATPPPPPSRLAGGSVRHSDITMFLRQLIMLLEAGTPILKSLRSLSERGEKAAQRSLVADIAQHVEMGNPLWQA